MTNWQNTLKSTEYKEIILKIYENKYFSNHGPLVKKFESEIEDFLNISNAVAVTNYALAILIAVAGSDKGGRIALIEGCEKDAFDAVQVSNVGFLNISIENFIKKLPKDVGIVMISSKILKKDNFDFFKQLIEKEIKVIICYSSILNFYEHNNIEGAISVCSLGPGTLVQGGVIATSKDEFAEIFRNIRSSYGVRKVTKVKATCNGRFSEIQAGIGLVLLQNIKKNLRNIK
jgi:hypothetical protein